MPTSKKDSSPVEPGVRGIANVSNTMTTSRAKPTAIPARREDASAMWVLRSESNSVLLSQGPLDLKAGVSMFVKLATGGLDRVL